METERKALYNSLRLNWLRDPTVQVEKWQVEDLRALSQEDLLLRINDSGLPFDSEMFHAFAENYDSPEEMAEALLAETEISQEAYDRIYLSLFELWRRLLPEKQSLSIFCDELDHQIHLYDTGILQNYEVFQDTINDLLEILNENVDNGIDPKVAIRSVNQQLANDVEEFLYDFISDEIDEGHFSYAADLVEGFYPFLEESKWFDLLHCRLLVESEGMEPEEAVQKLLKKAKEANLEFYFEILAFLSKRGDFKSYQLVAKKAYPLFEVEEDFIDFLSLTADFFHFHDDEAKESKILDISKRRSKNLESKFDSKDADLEAVKKLF